MQSFNDKTEKDTGQGEPPSYRTLGDSMVNDFKGWKMASRTRKVVLKYFSGTKTKNMKNLIISSYTLERTF